MYSLKTELERLEAHLPPNPPQFQVHASLPVAILRYDPTDEWELRRQLVLLAGRLDGKGCRLVQVSLADVFWSCLQDYDPPDAVRQLVEIERSEGFDAAQRYCGRALNPNLQDRPDLVSFAQAVAVRLATLDPERDVAFLTRAGVLGPWIYPVSNLVDNLQGRVRVPTVLCYPGRREGQTGLVFLDLPEREALGSYRVNIYG